jgi:hypothetical protein
MTKQLEGKESFGLYLTEIASSVLAISQQSALLLEALSERAVLLSDMPGQDESREAAGPTIGKAAQSCHASGPADGHNTSDLATGNSETTIA